YGVSPTNNTGITRAYGIWMLGTSRDGTYLQGLGDPDASAMFASGQHQVDNYVNVQSCEAGIRPGSTTPTYYPLGCSPGPTNVGYIGGGSGTSVWLPGRSEEH